MLSCSVLSVFSPLIVLFLQVGNLISPIPFGSIVDWWGRKPCILLTGPLYIISWIIVLTTRSVGWLYVQRIIQVLYPLYIISWIILLTYESFYNVS